MFDDDEWRPARLGDICILLPARTSLGYLENALDAAGIPYRAETSSLVYGSREVRDILAVLRAIDDPTNELALASALRSALFGCGDDDLFTYHVTYGGKWDVTAPLPDTLPDDHPVADAMRYLAELHAQRPWLAPSELLERIVEDRRVLELGASAGRFRDIARRIRFVVDQARSFGQATSGTLREYLAWALRQGAEGARVVETVLPETDDDAVRIMTVHGAKGLEFPIVIASGMTTRAAARRGGVQVLFPNAGGCEIRLASGIQTDQFELHKPVDEEMGFHEKLRLLYVACTRARDHLVVSAHRKTRNLGDDQSSWTHAELLWHAAAGAVVRRVRSRPRPACARCRTRPPRRRPTARSGRPSASRRSRAAAPVASSPPPRWRVGPTNAPRPPIPDLAKEPRDLELPPWNKGRYGTAIGRAVHAVLQTVDLATGAGIDDAAAAQAAAEGVLGQEATIAALARAAVASTTVQTASAHAHWRETYVAVPVEGLTLEGYVDLVFRDERGLVVVDYKTDAIGDEAELDPPARPLPHPGRGLRARGRGGRGRSRGRLRVRVPRSRRCPRGHDHRRRAGGRGRRGARPRRGRTRRSVTPRAGGVRRTLDSGRGVPDWWTREGRPLLRRVRRDRRPRWRRTGRVLRPARSRGSPVREDDLVRAVAPRDEQAGAPVVRLRQSRRRHDHALRRGPSTGEARRRAEGVHRRGARDRGPALLHATTVSTTRARPGRCSRT